MLLSKAVQHVEHSAARRLVGLQEHDVGVGSAGAQRGPLSIRGGEDGASHRVDTVGQRRNKSQPSVQKVYYFIIHLRSRGASSSSLDHSAFLHLHVV